MAHGLGVSPVLLTYFGAMSEDATPPEWAAGDVGDVGYLVIEVTFSEAVSSVGGYDGGVTIKVNSVSQTIVSAARQGDERIVHYTIAAQVDVNDTITWEYDDAMGDIADGVGNLLADVAAQGVANWVGSHLYFDTEDDLIWSAAL